MLLWSHSRWSPTSIYLALAVIGIIPNLTGVVGAASPARYSIRFADGKRFEGDDLTDWHRPDGVPKLNGRPLLEPDNPVRWIVNRSLPLPTQPRQFIETFAGDRIPGNVINYRPGDALFHEQLPPHFVLQQPAREQPLESNHAAPYRVATKWVRRIVWQWRREFDYQPQSVFLRNGGRLDYRVARFSEDRVTLLLNDGPRSVPFAEIAEIHLPQRDAWALYLDELALLAQLPPVGQATPPAPVVPARLMQIETLQGMVATTALAQMRPRTTADPKLVDRWLHGIQPAWSLDIIWIPHGDIRVRRFFATNEVPLTRVFPGKSEHRSALGGSPWPARVNINARGGPLRCQDGEFGWGFGVHATSELRFPINSLVTGFRTGIGLDRLAGQGGCVRARILHAPTNQPDHQSSFMTGSNPATEIGWLPINVDDDGKLHELVLHVDFAHQGRPAGADPLDIRDIANWVDPLLQLDAERLAAAIEARLTSQVAAWKTWRVVGATSTTCLRSPRFIEWADNFGRFEQTFAAIGQPLVLSQHRSLTSRDQWLVINATRSQNGENAPRLQVRVGGELVAEEEFPLWDKSHQVMQPIVVSLTEFSAPETQVEVELIQLPGSAQIPIQWHSIHISEQHPALYQLFEDEGQLVVIPAVNPQGKPADQDVTDYLHAPDAHSGIRSLRVAEEASLTLRLPSNAAIRERPQPGQYRFIFFAFRKDGGKLAADLYSSEAAAPRRYEAGPDAPLQPESKHVWKKELPAQWVPIPRDLFSDFGEFELSELRLSSEGAHPALFDHIYLARTQNDFQLAKTPAPPPDETARLARRELARPIRDRALPAVVRLQSADGRTATGTIISADGEIVTTGHFIVKPQQDVAVRLADNRSVKAKTLGICRELDLGLLKISDPPPFPFVDVHATDQFPTKPIYLGVAHAARASEAEPPAAHLVGIRRVLSGEVWTDFDVDALTTGGPLLGADGRLLAIHSRSSHFGGFCYSHFREWPAVLARLRKGEVWGTWRPGTGPMAGVEITNTVDGCTVTNVFDNSAAARVGLQIDDVITHVEGQGVVRLDQVYSQLATQNAGQEITIAFRRGDSSRQVKLPLMPRIP